MGRILRRSLVASAVVGTTVTLLNQADLLFSGPWPSSLYWKIPINYVIPFCVTIYGGMGNGRE